jgi:hypothetical protein
MPRIQPPEGYYTATETKKILNVSDAMVRIYVQKGRIKYFLPSGRKHGFYRKKDVDKLGNDLHIFLNLDEEPTSKFMRAREEDLPAIIEITKTLFGSGDDDSQVTPLEQRRAWMKKNSDIFYVLKREEEVIGFTYILPFKKGTDKIAKLLRSNFAGEVNITLDDIEAFQPGKRIDLYIVAIGMKPSIKYPNRRIYASRLISNLMDVVIELGRKGVIIETITAIGFSPEGRRLLQSTGFSEMPPPVPGKRAFHIVIEESGAPLILQYKQALQEYHSKEAPDNSGKQVIETTKPTRRKTKSVSTLEADL